MADFGIYFEKAQSDFHDLIKQIMLFFQSKMNSFQLSHCSVCSWAQSVYQMGPIYPGT